MAVTPRLVATDLDGTLVRSDQSISAYTAEVLRALDERGVPVVFVTGRPLRWAEEVFGYVGGHGLAIVSNGALVWDVHGHAAVRERPLDAERVLQVAERIRAAVPGTAFGVETLQGFGLEPEFVQAFAAEKPPRAPLAELVHGPVLKLLAKHDVLDPDTFAAAGVGAVGEVATVTHSSGRVSLLEISAPGVTKASTLAQVAAGMGVEAGEVVAFGDMPNDVEMLTWAGLSYAMADAHPRVRACARNLAPGHDEDGVARVLAGLFGL